MMLHRHFEAERNRENMTTLKDVTPNVQREREVQKEFVSEVFPPEEETSEAPKRRGRPRKSDG